MTFPPKTPFSPLPSSTSQLNNPLSLAPSGWALRLLVLFQVRRGGWDKGGASGKGPGKSPGDIESVLPVFLDRTVGSSPPSRLEPRAYPLREPGPRPPPPAPSPTPPPHPHPTPTPAPKTPSFKAQPPPLDLGSRARALHLSLADGNPLILSPSTSLSEFQY